MMKIFVTRRDLESWVSDHVGHGVTADDEEAIVEAIEAMDCPRYGEDWAEFLADLPDPLLDLIGE